ncbi:hypothetical protein BYT27DRAFT_7259397 [Phlegmacium glaucopus]|nr:hypothetical protein BYT27DRAFT_7259397 [Phlegmacium glaucopus]
MSETHRTTRSTNKDKHPGLPDIDEETLAKPIPKPRRTRVQILADAAATQSKKDKKLEDKQQEATRKAAGIKEIVQLESKMKTDANKSALHAAHPSAMSHIKKIPRPLGDVASLQLRYQGVDPHNTVLKPKVIELDDSENDDIDVDEDSKIVSSGLLRSRMASSTPSPKLLDSDIEIDGSEDGDWNVVPKLKVIIKEKASSIKKNKASIQSVINKHASTITADLSESVDGDTMDTSWGEKQKALNVPLLEDSSKNGTVKRIKPSTPSERHSSPAALALSIADNSTTTTDDARSNFDYGGYQDENDSIYEKAALPTGVPAKPQHLNLKSIVHIHRPGKAKVALANASLPPVEGKTRVKFTNHDLPHGVHSTWTKILVPRWLEIVGTYKNPWVLNSGINDAQALWDIIFPERKGLDVLKSSAEPIFSLKQRTYEWRGGFLLAATTAVSAFWETDPIYADPINHATYIEWGVPTDIDEPTPITWANVDESDPDNVIYKGAFLSAPVIAMFAHHLTVLDSIPTGDLILAHAEGALALSTMAVDHAFKQWSTGKYQKKSEGFSAALTDKTVTYLADIEGVESEKGWAKIMTAAQKFINENLVDLQARQRVALQSHLMLLSAVELSMLMMINCDLHMYKPHFTVVVSSLPVNTSLVSLHVLPLLYNMIFSG